MAGLSDTYLNLVTGKSTGWLAGSTRVALAIASLPYRAAIALRNLYYDSAPGAVRTAGRPVISIGNLTVGGTGKTPTAARIAQLLLDRGCRVAIITRGYKGARIDEDVRDEDVARSNRASDEARVLKRRCPRAQVIIDADRVAGAQRAVREGADCIVLDDGFQHRRLKRNLNIVLIDATAPAEAQRLLPRGLLREPLGVLRRADLVILTRSDEVEATARDSLLRSLKRRIGGKPVVLARHQITGLLDVKGRPVEIPDVSAMQAVIFAGIANFGSFRRAIEGMGVRVLAAYQYPDHHGYTADEIEGLADVAKGVEANILLTTEKDAVKLVGRWNEEACRLLVLNLEVQFEPDGDRILDEMLGRVLAGA